MQLIPGGACVADISKTYSIEKDMKYIMNKTSEYYPEGQQNQPKLHIVVVDSGINPEHPVFSGFDCYYQNYDCVNELTKGVDTNGHGTFVTGIICYILKDVKPMIKISIIKALNIDGLTNFSLLNGAYELLENKPELEDAFIVCQANGILDKPDTNYNLNQITGKKVLICAASNEGNWSNEDNQSNIAWPAKEALAIGSHDEHAQRSRFSPRGPELWVLAPGENIVSADARYGSLYPMYDRPEVSIQNGTSWAAAWVTALLAHFHLQLPHRYPGNVRFYLCPFFYAVYPCFMQINKPL